MQNVSKFITFPTTLKHCTLMRCTYKMQVGFNSKHTPSNSAFVLHNITMQCIPEHSAHCKETWILDPPPTTLYTVHSAQCKSSFPPPCTILHRWLAALRWVRNSLSTTSSGTILHWCTALQWCWLVWELPTTTPCMQEHWLGTPFPPLCIVHSA